jgi:tetratricopeptide (TPR) repeat protein
MDDPAADTEQDAIRRFLALREGLRSQGLTTEVEAIKDWLPQVRDPRMIGEMAKLLGFYWLRRGRYAEAIEFSERAAATLLDADVAYNVIFAQFQSQRWDDVVARAKQALEIHPSNFEFCNILSATLGAFDRLHEAHEYGTRSLHQKDAIARDPAFDLSGIPIPPFDPADPRYTEGAILNARAARFIYLGWTCRFYIDDSVPRPVVQALSAEGAQVVSVNGLPSETYGTLWRFLVANDNEVSRYIIRDADSVVNIRESAAVDEWLQSDRHFHLMRDHYDHSELVLAGMWGGVRGALPPLVPAIRAWLANARQLPGKTTDQVFLRERLWPTVRQSVLAHDSQFAVGETRDFPSVGHLPPGFWVGCDGRKMFAR